MIRINRVFGWLLVGILVGLVGIFLSLGIPKLTQSQQLWATTEPSFVTAELNPSVAQSQLPLRNQAQQSITEKQGLSLRLATDKQTYQLGEPILLTLTVTIVGELPILIYPVLDQSAGFVWTQICVETTVCRNYGGPGFGTVDLILGDPVAWSPGTQLQENRSILYDPAVDQARSFYAIAQAGTYTLQMVLKNIIPQEILTTAPVTIQVIEPSGEDRQVWRLLQTEDAASFLHKAYTPNPGKVSADFRAILAQYPNNFYAPYLRAAIDADQATQSNANPAMQAARSAASTALVAIDDQAYLIRPQTGAPATSTGVTAGAVQPDTIKTVVTVAKAWVEAWNARDIERLAQLYSYQTFFRQDWEAGEGNRSYQRTRKRIEALFTENGLVMVELVGFTIGAKEIIADVVGRFEHGKATHAFETMRFVLDDDGVWRIYSPGY